MSLVHFVTRYRIEPLFLESVPQTESSFFVVRPRQARPPAFRIQLQPQPQLQLLQTTDITMDGTTQTEVASSSASTQTSTQTSTPATDAMASSPTTDAGLFGDELISSDVVAALPTGYKLRALRQSDYHAGFLECLRVLTTVGDITEAQFADRFEWIRKQDGSYYVLVIEDAGRVVGTGALIAERKL